MCTAICRTLMSSWRTTLTTPKQHPVCYGCQVIQQWFLEMPDKLSKLLAARDAAGLPVKSDEERERLERRHEKEFLRSQGDYTEEVRSTVCSTVAFRLGSGAFAETGTVRPFAPLPP